MFAARLMPDWHRMVFIHEPMLFKTEGLPFLYFKFQKFDLKIECCLPIFKIQQDSRQVKFFLIFNRTEDILDLTGAHSPPKSPAERSAASGGETSEYNSHSPTDRRCPAAQTGGQTHRLDARERQFLWMKMPESSIGFQTDKNGVCE
jgi:hypothetical protein